MVNPSKLIGTRWQSLGRLPRGAQHPQPGHFQEARRALPRNRHPGRLARPEPAARIGPLARLGPQRHGRSRGSRPDRRAAHLGRPRPDPGGPPLLRRRHARGRRGRRSASATRSPATSRPGAPRQRRGPARRARARCSRASAAAPASSSPPRPTWCSSTSSSCGSTQQSALAILVGQDGQVENRVVAAAPGPHRQRPDPGQQLSRAPSRSAAPSAEARAALSRQRAEQRAELDELDQQPRRAGPRDALDAARHRGRRR